MAFKMDTEYRNSDEYKTWVECIKKDAPHLPLPIIEKCIIAHKMAPDAYKKDRDAKRIMKEPIKMPENKGEIVVDDAVKVTELTDDIIKQREDFWEKHTPKEASSITIEEVEA
jgi:hypothetical protein